MRALLLPRMTTNLSELERNENLLTSTLFKSLKLCDQLKDKILKNFLNENDFQVILDKTQDYDIIISRWMGDEINDLDKSKPIYEFHFDSLNGGWFFERYTHNNIQYKFGDNDAELESILGDIFFNPNHPEIGVANL